MNTALSYSRSLDFALFDQDSYKQPNDPDSVTPYAASFLVPRSPYASSEFRYSGNSLYTHPLNYEPGDEFELSPTGSLNYDSFTQEMEDSSPFGSSEEDDSDSAVSVKQEYDQQSPLLQSFERDIETLSPYFYPEDVQPPSVMFGFTNQHASPASMSNQGGNDSLAQGNSSAVDISFSLASDLSSAHSERPSKKQQQDVAMVDLTSPISPISPMCTMAELELHPVNSVGAEVNTNGLSTPDTTPDVQTNRSSAVSSRSSTPSDRDDESYHASGDEDDDEEFTLSRRNKTRSRRAIMSASPGFDQVFSAENIPSLDIQSRPRGTRKVPIPIPNLTKKSRGRRVPTAATLHQTGGIDKHSIHGRSFMCTVEGCGKCFARGEHLKRHVRSIHTNEKPHVCPYPGCGKDFSRHDNLGQHMRVHKGWNRA